MSKTVSVVLCTYNGAKYLREQLESVVNQTYPLHELLIQDDGSTDGTTDIAAEYAAKYPFVRCLQNDGKHGLNPNFFSAMRKATGDYIAICDQDDIWELDKIEKQVAAIGDSLMCTHRTVPFSEDGSSVRYDQRTPNIGLLRLQSTASLWSLLRLQGFFIRHRSEIFYTKGKDPQNFIRAFLFPVMQVYNYKYLLLA